LPRGRWSGCRSGPCPARPVARNDAARSPGGTPHASSCFESASHRRVGRSDRRLLCQPLRAHDDGQRVSGTGLFDVQQPGRVRRAGCRPGRSVTGRRVRAGANQPVLALRYTDSPGRPPWFRGATGRAVARGAVYRTCAAALVRIPRSANRQFDRVRGPSLLHLAPPGAYSHRPVCRPGQVNLAFAVGVPSPGRRAGVAPDGTRPGRAARPVPLAALQPGEATMFVRRLLALTALVAVMTASGCCCWCHHKRCCGFRPFYGGHCGYGSACCDPCCGP
jgi:hypothetical protein